MYIFRLVIDANRINAKKRDDPQLKAMTEIEKFHKAGIVEIFKTSTLPVEFSKDSVWYKKAKQYFQIGHSSDFQIQDIPGMQARCGAGGRNSRFTEICQIVFGVKCRRKGPKQEELDVNSMRDVLHLDQCWINNVDYFITNENNMINANDELNKNGIDFKVCDAKPCLNDLKEYFFKHYNTTDINDLSKIIKNTPPIILGSNSCTNVKLVDKKTCDVLFEVFVEENIVKVFVKLYSLGGKKLITIIPGKDFKIEECDIGVKMMTGKANILLGKNTCIEFSITLDDICYLSARQMSNNHILFYKGKFNNKYGETVGQIEKESLILTGSDLCFKKSG